MSEEPTASTLDVAELVATRLCHDLAGLCGTLQGALELLGDEPEAAAEAAALSQEAARALSHRLRLIRAAWGRTAEPLDRAAIAALAFGLPGAPRVTLDMAGLAPGTVFPPGPGRVLLNALLLAAESLRGGGTLHLRGDRGVFVIELEGQRAAWPARLAERLGAAEGVAGAVLAEGPRALQVPMLGLLARQAGARLSLVPASAADAPAGLRIAWPA